MGDSREGKQKIARRIPPPVEVDEDTVSVDILDQFENDSDIDGVEEEEKVSEKEGVVESEHKTWKTETESDIKDESREGKIVSDGQDVPDMGNDFQEDESDSNCNKEPKCDHQGLFPTKQGLKRKRKEKSTATKPNVPGTEEDDESDEQHRKKEKLRL